MLLWIGQKSMKIIIMMSFVRDLVRYTSQKPVYPFIQRFSLTPAVGTKNQEASLELQLNYFGAEASNALSLEISGDPLWEQTIAIPALHPYEKRLHSIKLPLQKMSGAKTIQAVLRITGEKQDNKIISSYAQLYTIQANGRA
jgi:hypothetical protein